MYIYPTITINGVSSTTIAGLLVTSLPPISKPAQRALVDVIDGRDGDVITPLGFAAYDKPVGIALTKGYDIDEVIKFFNSSGVVTFSNEPDKYYNFAIYEQIAFERLIRFKTATVIFHVQPYKYANNENPLNFAITSGVPVIAKNSGNTYSKPDLIITGEGVVNLEINGEHLLNIDFGEDEQTYIIDSNEMNAYATENAIKSLVASIPYEQDGDGEPSPENVRTLSGYTEATVTRTGKNIFDKTEMVISTQRFVRYGVDNYNDTLPNGKFRLNANQAYTFTFSGANSTNFDSFGVYNDAGTRVATVYNNKKATFTPASTGAYFLAFSVSAGNWGGTWDNYDIQLELGSTATAYEVYSGETQTIDLEQAIFGGLIDFITGKLSVNKYFMLLTGDESEDWTVVNSGTPNYYYALTFPSGTGSAVAGSNISNIFPTANIANNNTLQGCYTTVSGVRVRWGEEKTLSEWREFLGANNMQLLYELVTPQEYLLTPTNVKALIGLNKISADISNVTVTYKAGGAIHTSSGALVSFTLTINDYERGAFVNRQIVGNYDNIRLKSGNNTIVLTGDATRLIIEKYSRWI